MGLCGWIPKVTRQCEEAKHVHTILIVVFFFASNGIIHLGGCFRKVAKQTHLLPLVRKIRLPPIFEGDREDVPRLYPAWVFGCDVTHFTMRPNWCLVAASPVHSECTAIKGKNLSLKYIAFLTHKVMYQSAKEHDQHY